LLLRRSERRHHRQRIDQRQIAGALDTFPIGLELVGIEIGLEGCEKRPTIDRILLVARRKVGNEGRDAEGSEGLMRFLFLKQAETANPRELYDVATVARFGKRGDAPKAANRRQMRLILLAQRRLHHADQPIARQGGIEHGKIARLENIEGQLARRQQQRAAKRKNSDRIGKITGLQISCIPHLHRDWSCIAGRRDTMRPHKRECGAALQKRKGGRSKLEA